MKEWTRGATVVPAPDYVDARILSTTAETFSIPTGANYVSMVTNAATTELIYISYIKPEELSLISNGDFATDDVWTKGGTWTIAAGGASRTASASGLDISQDIPTLISGKAYSVTFTNTVSASTVQPVLGGTAGTARGSGTFTETIAAGSSNTLLAFRATATTAATIDDVSILPVAAVTGADVTTGVGCEAIYGNNTPFVRDISGLSKLSMIAASGTPKITLAYYSAGSTWVR